MYQRIITLSNQRTERESIMIYTEEMIWEKALEVKGTYIKRNNLRKRLKTESNNEVNDRIEKIKTEIRALKASGVRNQALAPIYAKITHLEMRIL